MPFLPFFLKIYLLIFGWAGLCSCVSCSLVAGGATVGAVRLDFSLRWLLVAEH